MIILVSAATTGGILGLVGIAVMTNESWRIPLTSGGLWFMGLLGRTKNHGWPLPAWKIDGLSNCKPWVSFPCLNACTGYVKWTNNSSPQKYLRMSVESGDLKMGDWFQVITLTPAIFIQVPMRPISTPILVP